MSLAEMLGTFFTFLDCLYSVEDDDTITLHGFYLWSIINPCSQEIVNPKNIHKGDIYR